MNEKEYDLIKEVRELIWELRVWAREGENAKGIRDKIWQELVVKIEEYLKKEVKNERHKNNNKRIL